MSLVLYRLSGNLVLPVQRVVRSQVLERCMNFRVDLCKKHEKYQRELNYFRLVIIAGNFAQCLTPTQRYQETDLHV